jgi:phosphoribosylaminoimidazolecarboxamide formyltransferase / IMP cyclohydrolase
VFFRFAALSLRPLFFDARSRINARSLSSATKKTAHPQTTQKQTKSKQTTGRVKTLHPGVHGGILAVRSNPAHKAALEAHKIAPIDVVAVNLYPFRETVTRTPPPSFDEGVENIDIGGPAMIRAAAKNHADVAVCVDPADYGLLLEALGAEQKEGGAAGGGGGGGGGGARSPSGAALRKRLAWKAYQHTASYDAQVSEWLWAQGAGGGGEDGGPDAPPPEITVPLKLALPLRYGENPHQRAAFYADLSLAEAGLRSGVGHSVQHHGKEMSYNNYLDADAAFTTVSDFASPACVVVKHTNPCGVATTGDESDGAALLEAYRAAVRADPISAFGGIVAFNREVSADMAREIREFRSPTDGETRMFYEIVIAPGYSPEGLEILKGKSKALRILEAPLRSPTGRQLRQVSGGWLWQGPDSLTPSSEGGKKDAGGVEFTVVSEAQPTPAMLLDLATAWRCVKHVKSNAIAVAKEGRMLGMGSGQPNRVKSTQIALEKAGAEAKGAALASDAFFPFSWGDSVELACQAGVVAIAHPGGSIRDEDAVACCNKYGVVLVTTGVRHFKH